MNYLAHLYLADDSADSRIGSLMGDFVKGTVGEQFPPARRNAIIQHRKIDTFTDAHPVVRQSKHRLSPRFRRYSGILIDMFYDHFLAKHWSRYAEVPLPAFTEEVYQIVAGELQQLPWKMQRSMQYMTRTNLLVQYQSIEGLRRALLGIETRLSRPSALAESVVELKHLYPELLSDFECFLPELIAFVDNGIAEYSDGLPLRHRQRRLTKH